MKAKLWLVFATLVHNDVGMYVMYLPKSEGQSHTISSGQNSIVVSEIPLKLDCNSFTENKNTCITSIECYFIIINYSLLSFTPENNYRISNSTNSMTLSLVMQPVSVTRQSYPYSGSTRHFDHSIYHRPISPPNTQCTVYLA